LPGLSVVAAAATGVTVATCANPEPDVVDRRTWYPAAPVLVDGVQVSEAVVPPVPQ
jgi:hypothetical protein